MVMRGCRSRARRALGLAATGALLATITSAAVEAAEAADSAAWGAITTRISLSSSEREGNDASRYPALSASGRFVVFVSSASNLVRGDTNAVADVFIRDRLTGVTRRVSVGRDGRQADLESRCAAISADGRYVVFTSEATNLVPGDTNGFPDAFVRDLVRGTTRRVSVGVGGSQAESGGSGWCAISADGHVIGFGSGATNLVPDDTNGVTDVFVRDLIGGVTERVSVGTGGQQGDQFSFSPALSADGRYIAFTSYATTLVAGDTNAASDVFLHDRMKGTTRRVSVGADYRQGDGPSDNASISADGRIIAFTSWSSNLVDDDTNNFGDVFVRDRAAVVTERVSVGPRGLEGDGDSFSTAMSADGRFVAFESWADNLVLGDTNGLYDVFMTDRAAGTTRRVSVGPHARQANGDSEIYFGPAVSADGRHVAFTSYATNLVAGDTNDTADVFVRSGFSDQCCATITGPTGAR
jgi:Tol biopolymer transport system component